MKVDPNFKKRETFISCHRYLCLEVFGVGRRSLIEWNENLICCYSNIVHDQSSKKIIVLFLG